MPLTVVDNQSDIVVKRFISWYREVYMSTLEEYHGYYYLYLGTE
jgi:hypothetical protein